jgi:N-acetylmuramoyl-L-alanine amidase
VARLLRRGDRDVAVGEIRAKLTLIGFSVECSEPEFFDDRMDQAVRAFQQARGLNVDGIVGPHTLQRIEEARWSLGDRPLSYTPGHLSHGDDVISLQQRLSDMGFDCGKVDGIFGPRTEVSLKEFQKSVGAEVDGIAGTETFAALKRLNRTVSGGHAEKLRHAALMDSVRTGVRDKTIVIDPGHGGDDFGVSAFDLNESEIVLDVASRIEGRLGALGVAVYLTRGSQSSPIDDGKRAEFANQSGADLFLSLHLDANLAPDARGVATYYYGNDAHGAHSVVGQRLASLIQREICARTDLLDCRVHAKTWELLRNTRMPAVRVELGYLTNPGDAARLRDGNFREVLAESLAIAIQRLYLPDDGEGETGVLRLSDLREKI